jgi:hypothetical protein
MFSPASVLDFGADPTGTTDSSDAFGAAQSASDTIIVPNGTYIKNANTTITSGKTWLFYGAVIKHSSDTATMFTVGSGVADWNILGHLVLEGMLTTNVDTGECGIHITNPHRGYIQRITCRKFKGKGVVVDGSNGGGYRGDGLTIDSLGLYENRQGFEFVAGNGAEYLSVGRVEAVGNIFAGTIAAGNCQIHGGNISDNYYGPLLGSGSNHGHGGLHGLNLNHNTYWNLKAENVTAGFTIDACHIYADSATTGKVVISNSSGISLRGGIVDATIEVTGTGKNLMEGAFVPTSLTTVSGANPANLIRRGNYSTSGLWGQNNA